MSELVYRIGDINTIDQQVKLFDETFNTNSTVKGWKRKHIDNPLSGKCTVMCAFDGDKVVGVNGFLPMDYEYKGQVIHTVQSCDTAVNPNYRGQGIFTKMIANAQDHFKNEGFDAVVGFPNQNSYHGFTKKLGWIEMHRTMKYFYPNTVKSVAKNMLGKNVPAFLNPMASVWRNLFCGRYLVKSSGYSVEKKTKINADDFISMQNTEKIHIKMTDEYMNWKLSAGYGLYIAKNKNNEEVCRLLVCNFVISESYKRGNILLVQRTNNADATSFKTGAAMILKKLSKEYDILSVWQQEDSIVNESLKKLGFIANFSEKEGSPFIVKVLTEDDEKKSILLNSERWEPSFIEADYVLDSNVKE